MLLLGKHRRDDDEDVYTLETTRQDKRIRESPLDESNDISLLQRYAYPAPGSLQLQPLPSPSDSESSDSNSPSSLMSPPGPVTDVEMEEDDVPDISPKTTMASRSFSRPARLNPQSLHSHMSESGGRVPTPIKGGFLRNNLASPSQPVAGMSSGSIQSRMVTCRMRDREYFMPTPVTEAAIETPTAIAGDCFSRLTVAGEENMDMDDNPILSPDPVRRGRTRSGAIIDKRRFAMGYRDDCEKCRLRVPGHFSHFLPT